MVQADRRDDGEIRPLQDVGGIQASAKARFYDGDIHLLCGKPAETETGSDFEEGKPVRGNPVHPLREESKHVLLGDKLPVHAHALAEVYKVRRGKKAGLEATGSAGRCQHVGYRALAVGAGHMDAAKLARRVAQGILKGSHTLQTGFIGTRCKAVFLHRGESVENILNKPQIRCF